MGTVGVMNKVGVMGWAGVMGRRTAAREGGRGSYTQYGVVNVDSMCRYATAHAAAKEENRRALIRVEEECCWRNRRRGLTLEAKENHSIEKEKRQSWSDVLACVVKVYTVHAHPNYFLPVRATEM